MSQTKLQSFKEATSNAIAGFALSALIQWQIVIPATFWANNKGISLLLIAILTTILFCIISVVRNYIVRRWFNKSVLSKK